MALSVDQDLAKIGSTQCRSFYCLKWWIISNATASSVEGESMCTIVRYKIWLHNHLILVATLLFSISSCTLDPDVGLDLMHSAETVSIVLRTFSNEYSISRAKSGNISVPRSRGKWPLRTSYNRYWTAWFGPYYKTKSSCRNQAMNTAMCWAKWSEVGLNLRYLRLILGVILNARYNLIGVWSRKFSPAVIIESVAYLVSLNLSAQWRLPFIRT